MANIHRQLAASNFTDKEREELDYYATEPKATQMFLERIKEDLKLNKNLWEPACGGGHMSKVLKENGYNVVSTDIKQRGYADELMDFLSIINNPYPDFDIITNPPFRMALDFVEKALDLLEDGRMAIFFLKIQFLEGKARNMFFKKNPPKAVYIHSSRVVCAAGGNFDVNLSSAVCYAWYIFEKGYKGDTVVRWID